MLVILGSSLPLDTMAELFKAGLGLSWIKSLGFDST